MQFFVVSLLLFEVGFWWGSGGLGFGCVCCCFLKNKNQLPEAIKDLLWAKCKSLNICCGRPWGRGLGLQEGQGGWEEVTLNRLFHHGAALGEQRAVSAIFRRTVWDRKYKQMIYNIKQDVTKLQQQFNPSLRRVFVL